MSVVKRYKEKVEFQTNLFFFLKKAQTSSDNIRQFLIAQPPLIYDEKQTVYLWSLYASGSYKRGELFYLLLNAHHKRKT